MVFAELVAIYRFTHTPYTRAKNPFQVIIRAQSMPTFSLGLPYIHAGAAPFGGRRGLFLRRAARPGPG